MPSSFRAVCFAINGCCVFFLIATRATYDLGIGVPFLNSPWPPILVGLMAFRFPSLTAWPALALHWTKLHAAAEAGWGSVGGADYIIVPDLALLLTICIASYSTYTALSKTVTPSAGLPEVAPRQYYSAVVLVAAAVHLSNYFYSGLEKMLLPHSFFWTWALENKTYLLSANAADAHYFTIQNLFPGYANIIYVFNRFANLPLNLSVLFGQLLALTCLTSMRKAATVTAFYDLMHTSIFLLTGIFFWKWIILNAAFMYAFRSIRRTLLIPMPFRLFCCGIVLVAPMFFHIVRLAWFDTGAVNQARFYAVTVSGERISVPSNFFVDSSIDVSQERFSRPYTGFLPTGTWGTTSDADVMRRVATDCEAAVEGWQLSASERARISFLLSRQKGYWLANKQGGANLDYDLYPHHIWSAFWMFGPFRALDLATVKSFVLVVESKCTSINADGSVTRKVVGHGEYQFAF